MTTYQTQSSFAELSNGEPLSEGTLAYFRERQRIRIHELVISEFLKSGLSKAGFARRIGRDPAQITRWLANPGNWELDTISDFLLGISGGELDPQVAYPAKAETVDQSGPDWLTSSVSDAVSTNLFADFFSLMAAYAESDASSLQPIHEMQKGSAQEYVGQGKGAQDYSANDNNLDHASLASRFAGAR